MPTSTTDALARLADAEVLMRRKMERGWGKAMEEVARYAKEHHKFVNRSGETEASIEGGILDTQPDPTKIVGVVTASHAAIFLETTRGGKKGTEEKGEPIGDGLFIRKNWAFLSTAIDAMQGEVLKIAADEAKK
jgi:hypothetical protein